MNRMNVEQRVKKLIHQIEDCITNFNSKPSYTYLHEFERYQVMGETILEKYRNDRLEYLVEVKLPKLIRQANQL